MDQLGLGPSDVYAAGGPSPTTLRELLKADVDADGPDRYRDWWPHTLRKIDTAMQWVPNSARNLLAGGEAEVLPASAAAPSRLDQVPASGPRRVRISGFEMVIDDDVERSATDLQALETAARDIVAGRLLEIREARRRDG